MGEGGVVVVTDGIFTAWTDQVPASYPVFGYLGYPADEPAPQVRPDATTKPSPEAAVCVACTAVREGTVSAFREQQAADRQALRDANANRKAEQARAGFKVV